MPLDQLPRPVNDFFKSLIYVKAISGNIVKIYYFEILPMCLLSHAVP